MYSNSSPSSNGEHFPENSHEMDLGTPARLESKIQFQGYLDCLLGTLDDGTLFLDDDNADGFECVIDDKDVFVETHENIKDGIRDYCMSIGEVVLGSSGNHAYLEKIYTLRAWGKFTVRLECDLAIEAEEFDNENDIYDNIIENELTTYKNLKKFTKEERKVFRGHQLVTEGEAQEIIQLLSSIARAQS